MRDLIRTLGALGAGALAMYYLDPQLGAHRRALLRDLLAGGKQPVGPAAGRLGRRTYHHVPQSDPQRDAELRDQIRNRLDRLVSFPRALHVQVDNGVVRLSGNVLRQERDGLLLQVQAMPGVEKLVNATTAHDQPNGVPQLQAAGGEDDARQPPGTRLAA